MEESEERRYYSPGLFDDEVIENIRANIQFIAEDRWRCIETLEHKSSKYKNELIYCYYLGEDYAMANPHAISAVWFLTEDQQQVFSYDINQCFIGYSLAQDLLVGQLVNDSYKAMLREGPEENSYSNHSNESGVNPTDMALEFRERRNLPWENPVMDRHKKDCVICFLAGIRNVFKAELKKQNILQNK